MGKVSIEEMSMGKTIKAAGDIGDVISAYLNEKPDKREICPLVMVLLDYYTDDNSEELMTLSQFMANSMRKRCMLQDLIEKWRRL